MSLTEAKEYHVSHSNIDRPLTHIYNCRVAWLLKNKIVVFFFIDEGDVETGVKIVLGAGGGQLQAPHSFMGGGNNQQLPAPLPAPSITPPVERRARREVRRNTL